MEIFTLKLYNEVKFRILKTTTNFPSFPVFRLVDVKRLST